MFKSNNKKTTADYKKIINHIKLDLVCFLQQILSNIDGLDPSYCKGLNSRHIRKNPKTLLTIEKVAPSGECHCVDEKASKKLRVPLGQLDCETLFQIGFLAQEKRIDCHPGRDLWEKMTLSERYNSLRLYLSFVQCDEMMYDESKNYHAHSLQMAVDRSGISGLDYLNWIVIYGQMQQYG